MYLKLVFFLLVPFEIIGFNIDTNNYVVYVDPQKTATSSPTYFGYTVVLYPGDRNSKTGQWIKIGAPKGQEPNSKFKNTGVIYDCPFMKKCNIVNIKKGDGRLQFDNSWIGGSMDISYKFQKLSICGFRVIFKKPGLTNKMAGACYLSDLETNKITENMPFLQNMRWRYRYLNETTYYYELGEAGFAAHHPQDEDVLLLGAPGVFNWAGTLIKVTPREVYIANPENSVVNYANDLFGYSITSGYYNSRTKLYYVATTPKSYDYKGKVAVVQFNNDKPLKKYTTITGHQFGEYFGASTTSGDLNGDNFDDLVIGAPFHKGKTFNEGAVYIFLGGDGRRLQLFNVLHGEHPKGQFGSAVMFLGDINNDGFGDLAIGAPYEEEYSGVLYIYKGNKEGVDSIYCQRIIGKRISPGIQGFGISISRPADIDQNGYNDLVVGAHLSGNAILLRTRPVVVVKYEMKSFPEELREDTREFILNVCYWYTLYNETKIISVGSVKDEENLGCHLHNVKGNENVVYNNILLFLQPMPD